MSWLLVIVFSCVVCGCFVLYGGVTLLFGVDWLFGCCGVVTLFVLALFVVLRLWLWVRRGVLPTVFLLWVATGWMWWFRDWFLGFRLGFCLLCCGVTCYCRWFWFARLVYVGYCLWFRVGCVA